MGALWQLLRKDLLAQRWAMGILLFLTVAWHIFLWSKVGTWPQGIALALGLIPFGFILLWIFWVSLQIYRREWSEDTVYFLMALPKPSWLVMGVKLLTVIVCAFVSVGAMIASYLLFLNSEVEAAKALVAQHYTGPLYLGNLINGGALMFLFFVLFVILIQFSYICSRMVNRFRGLVTMWVFVISLRLGGILASIFEPAFRWLPPVTFSIPGVVVGATAPPNRLLFSSGLFAACFLVGIGFFALGNWLWENQIQVA